MRELPVLWQAVSGWNLVITLLLLVIQTAVLLAFHRSRQRAALAEISRHRQGDQATVAARLEQIRFRLDALEDIYRDLREALDRLAATVERLVPRSHDDD